MAQPQDHIPGISAPPVLTSTPDDVPQLRSALEAYEELLEKLPRSSPDSDSDSDPFLLSSRPSRRLDRTDRNLFLNSDPFLHLSHLLDRTDCDSFVNSSLIISGPSIKTKARYGYNFPLGLRPPHDGRAPPSPAFTDKLFAANPCPLKGKAIEAPPTGGASFKQMFGFFGLGTDSGLGPHHPKYDNGGISALPSDAGVDLELGYLRDEVGGIREHLLRAERHAYYNQDLISYKQWKAYIKDLKIVKSGASHSMLIHSVIALLGEAFGGALANALSSSSEPSQLQSLVQTGILIGVGLTVAGIGLRRFKRRLSDNVMKAGAMGTALAIIVAFASLLPPWLAWSLGAATSILVVTGLAII